MKFNIIVAVDQENGIGKDNSMPWYISRDLKNFKEITLRSNIIMGRNTWKSLGCRPLIGRHNIVVTSDKTLFKTGNKLSIAKSLKEALYLADEAYWEYKFESTFVIGGTELFREALDHPNLSLVYLTEIYNTFKCDRFFPDLDLNKFKIIFLDKLDYQQHLTDRVYYRSIILKSNSKTK